MGKRTELSILRRGDEKAERRLKCPTTKAGSPFGHFGCFSHTILTLGGGLN
jgi:hypothetical protein